MPGWWMLTFGAYALMSMLALALFAWDKRAAVTGHARISERTLHIVELLGGWPGVLLAMKVVRHKNRKAPFWVVTGAIIVLHLAMWAGLWWLLRTKVG